MKPCLLFLGPDRGKQQHELKRALETLTRESGEEPEVLHRYADQDSLDQILDNLKNGSLFYSRLFVVVYRAEFIGAADAKKIQAYWKNPHKQSTVIFVSEEYREVKDRFKFAASDEILSFWEPDEKEKPRWIRNYLGNKGGKISDEALDLLADLVEADTLSMQRECDTLLFLTESGEIGIGDVETYISHSREESVYTLFEAIVKLDLEHALSVLQKILLSQSSETIQLLIGLQWQFRSFANLQRQVGAGPASRDVFYANKVKHPHTMQVFNAALKKWTAVDIERRLRSLAVFDLQLRQARPGSQGLLFELLLYQLILRPSSVDFYSEKYPLFA